MSWLVGLFLLLETKVSLVSSRRVVSAVLLFMVS
jgi:hypothetical protein